MKFWATLMEKLMIEHKIEARIERRKADGSYFYDFAKHAFGILALEIEADKDQEITIAVGDVAANEKIVREPGGSRIYQEQKLKVKAGKHYYEMKMQHPGYGSGTLKLEREICPFRYAEVRNCDGKIKAFQLAFFGPFNDDAAHFSSSDENLNKIWEFCKYTMKATSVFGIFVDGNRERQAYEGDTYINQLGFFCCDDNYKIAYDTIERLFEFPTWPAEWFMCMPLIVKDYLLYTGDADSISSWYPALKEKLLLELASEKNMLISMEHPNNNYNFPGFSHSGLRELIDWPINERDDYEFGKFNLVPNCWHYAALQNMSWLAAELNKNDDAKFYYERAEMVKKSINRFMLKDGIYVDNPDSAHTAMHSLLFPLAFNVAPENNQEKLLKLLQQKGMSCSVFAAQFLLEALYKNRKADYAKELMTANTLRSWANMLNKGATITMEAWDDSVKPNQDWNHAWGAAPANIIPRYIVGIRPIQPGFDCFALDPQPGKLEYLEAKIPCRHGSIYLKYNKGKINITIPKGTKAIYKKQELQAGKHKLKL